MEPHARARASRSPSTASTVAGSAAEAVEGADVVVTMLSDGAAVEAVAGEASVPRTARCGRR